MYVHANQTRKPLEALQHFLTQIKDAEDPETLKHVELLVDEEAELARYLRSIMQPEGVKAGAIEHKIYNSRAVFWPFATLYNS